MVSPSSLPGPGTVSDNSEPVAVEHSRSGRPAGWETADLAASEMTVQADELTRSLEASGALEPTGTVEAIDTVAPMKTIGFEEEERAHSDTSEAPPVNAAEAAPAKSPVHWVVGAHWLGRWRTPLAVRLWRYGAGSIVAFATSTVVLFICLSWFDLGAISSTVIAFLAGAIPNWVLNRRWAWGKRGREGMIKETSLYLIVSLVALAASSAADKFTAVEAGHLHSELAKDLLVTFAYMFSVVVLTGLKYVAYDRVVFVDRPNSRTQVLTTTEQNR
jgi:putative flippase GtrA